MINPKQFDRVKIILHKTQMIENIGFCLRTAANFGFNNIRLSDPRCEMNLEKIWKISCQCALNPISNLKIFLDFESSISDLQFVYASSIRSRSIRSTFLSSENLNLVIQKNLEEYAGDIGIVFGPENSGLSNHEVSLCDKVFFIDTDQKFSSMNISHSVAVLLYEARKALVEENKTTNQNTLESLAPRLEVISLINRLRDHLSIPEKMAMNLQSTIIKCQLTSQELSTIHGIISRLLFKGND